MKKHRFLFLCFCIALAGLLRGDCSTSSPRPKDDSHYGETKAQRDTRMAWWREAKFGMFIHWGIYSVPAGVYQGKDLGGAGEWLMHDAKIPVADYAQFASQFNPVKFDAEAWVQMAQDAGFKYIVITAKHHDGFAMYPSAVGGFNIGASSPFKRDPLKELAAACRKHGLKLGFYYSQNQDWHQSGGSAAGGHWDQAQDGSTDDYLAKVSLPQVKELLTNYGPGVPAVLWWDTPQTEMTPERAALFQPLLKSRPDLITNNRLSSNAAPGLGYPGDTETPEQEIPANGFPGLDWETCMTINGTWGYKSGDQAWKPSLGLLRNLVDIASKGGNYLLNVGPTSEGLIPDPEVERLKELGAWLKVNGQAIYGSHPWLVSSEGSYENQAGGSRRKPVFSAQDIRFTAKGSSIYAVPLAWPDHGTLLIRSLAQQAGVVKSVKLLGSQEKLHWVQGSDGLQVSLPEPSAGELLPCLKIEGKGLKPVAQVLASPTPTVIPTQPPALKALPGDFHGKDAGRVISINFVGGGFANGIPEAMGASEAAGLLSAAHWNNALGASGSSAALLDGAGHSSGATLEWQSANTWSSPAKEEPGDFRMMKGYLDSNEDTGIQVKLQGIPQAFQASGYRVYAYYDGDEPGDLRTGIYEIAGVERIGADPRASVFAGKYSQAWDPSAASSQNVVVFDGLKGGSFTLNARPLDSTGEHLRAPLCGLQIIAEPAK